jgi:hypothetical protein
MTQLKMLSADDKLAEIRRLYFDTSKQTIQQDLEKALALLKSMTTEEEREKAAVYMEGLAEMRSDWLKAPKTSGGGRRPSKSPGRAARGSQAGSASSRPPKKR